MKFSRSMHAAGQAPIRRQSCCSCRTGLQTRLDGSEEPSHRTNSLADVTDAGSIQDSGSQEARSAVHDNRVFQAHMRQEVADAVLGELLDVVAGCLAAQDDALGLEFNRQVADAPAGTNLDVLLQLKLLR